MKIGNIFSSLKNLQLSKDKLLLILLGGVLLVIISLPVKEKAAADDAGTSKETTNTVEPVQENASDYASGLEGKLEKILSQVEGAGRVMVFVNFKDSGELIVKSDISESTKTDGVTADGQLIGEKR